MSSTVQALYHQFFTALYISLTLPVPLMEYNSLQTNLLFYRWVSGLYGPPRLNGLDMIPPNPLRRMWYGRWDGWGLRWWCPPRRYCLHRKYPPYAKNKPIRLTHTITPYRLYTMGRRVWHSRFPRGRITRYRCFILCVRFGLTRGETCCAEFM